MRAAPRTLRPAPCTLTTASQLRSGGGAASSHPEPDSQTRVHMAFPLILGKALTWR